MKKLLVLGLVSLALLECVCKQTTRAPLIQKPTLGRTTRMIHNNKFNNTRLPRNSSTNDPAGANHTSDQTGTSSTVTWATGVTSTKNKVTSTENKVTSKENKVTSKENKVTSKENKVTKNGQGQIFTSVTLLLGSSVLTALWQ